MGVVNLSEREFEQEVLHSQKLVLVDFWTPWCVSCLTINKFLDELAQKYDSKLKIFKLNIVENQTIATKYQILGLPTLLFFKDGKIVKQMVGSKTQTDIKKEIDALC